MRRHLALVLLCLNACSDEPQTAESPAICTDEVVENLPPFAPCFSDQQCAFDVCLNGFCTEPCVEDDDCLEYSGPGIPSLCQKVTVESVNGVTGGCVYSCHGYALEGYCPQFEGWPMKCEVVPGPAQAGMGDYTCVSDFVCE